MTDDELQSRLARKRFARSSKYEASWIIANMMGPHVLWLAEYLCEALILKPGMRVLDLGCGKAISSIFLAKEFAVNVVACDLWIKPDENARRIADASVSTEVRPVHGEAHALPFEPNSFDAIVSLDAYHYFGTDDLYLGTIAKFLKPGGQIGIVVPGVRHEIDDVPDAIKPWWDWEFCSFHSPHWWRRHWVKTGLVEVETADWMFDGHALWLQWLQLTKDAAPRGAAAASREISLLEADREKLLGFTRLVGRKPA